jgi:hypothetical protein
MPKYTVIYRDHRPPDRRHIPLEARIFCPARTEKWVKAKWSTLHTDGRAYTPSRWFRLFPNGEVLFRIAYDFHGFKRPAEVDIVSVNGVPVPESMAIPHLEKFGISNSFLVRNDVCREDFELVEEVTDGI